MAARTLLLALHVLDHQLLATDGRFAGKVDDAELSFHDPEHPHLAALLSGPGVLATRLGHRTYGGWRERIEHHIDSPSGRTARIPMSAVRSMESGITVNLTADELAAHGSERWVADHVIGHIPGNGIEPPDADPSPPPSSPSTLPQTSREPVAGTTVPRDVSTGGGSGGGHGRNDGSAMRASALLGRPVTDLDGTRIGIVLDIRLVQDGLPDAGLDARLRIDGLIVGHGRFPQRSGLLRHQVHGPWLLRAAARRLGPDRRYLEWTQVDRPDELAAGGGSVVARAATGPIPS